MKNKSFKYIINLLFIFFGYALMFSQNESTKKIDTIATIPDLEKVYLHTDRDYYSLGETLWYKAYSVYAYTNVLFDYSKTLYVELVSEESKIVARNVTRLEKGIGHGDFSLNDSLDVKPGTYKLRAYTNWMRNFDESFVFSKKIEIVDLNNALIKENKDQKSIKKKKTSVNIQNSSFVDIQFFPEGGALIDNVLSVVAFKAVGKSGKPKNVNGSLYDSSGNYITGFKSTYQGMGKFTFTPEANQKYYAEIDASNGEKVKVNLPEAQQNGYMLNITSRKGKYFISIKTNQSTLKKSENKKVSLIASTRGITYFEGSLVINSLNTSYILPVNRFPEGICRITLYDDLNKPHSERLYYLKKENDIDVIIASDKKSYSPKEKVELSLSVKTKSGVPVDASFSIASVDQNMENGENDKMNICSYYLLECDIKGHVLNPGYYFNNKNLDRLYNLDLLLLTQGWRDFLWKKIPVRRDISDFRLEKGLKISGKVTSLIGAIPKAYSLVDMLLSQDGKFINMKDTTNVNGYFTFNKVFFKGTSTLLINTKNKKGKAKGYIHLDSLYRKPLTINFNDAYNFNLDNEEKINEVTENIYRNNVQFNIPMENILDEIVLTGKRKKEIESIYGMADYSYTVPDEGMNFSTIYQLLQFNIPGINITNGIVRFNRAQEGVPLILVDGIEIEQEELEIIAPENVAKIETINTSRAAVFGSRGANGAIIIYTKEGILNKKIKTFNSIADKIQGYQDTRVFYSPNYEEPDTLKENLADVRNTLYWNPYLHPDEDGNAKATYFNSDVKTNVNIIVEGITTTGIPLVVRSTYRVE